MTQAPASIAAQSRGEYLARVHRVMDYIEGHLDASLTLNELARVACFSPYHFHRIFSALTGESLYQFISRLRLERAATQLRTSPRKSITAVALDCGFGSSATFARAFRAAFGMSASAWRRLDSKNCKTVRKPCKDEPQASPYGALVTAQESAADEHTRRIEMAKKQNAPMATKEAQSVTVETLSPMAVVYVRHVGPYAGDAALFERLFGTLMTWAGARGLITPESRTLTIYHDNPEVTDDDKLRISVCLTVPPGTRGEGEVGSMEIPGGKYARAHFELGVTEYGAAWNWLIGTWLPASGFQPDERPCFEMCDPSQTPIGDKYRVDIYEPVKPL